MADLSASDYLARALEAQNYETLLGKRSLASIDRDNQRKLNILQAYNEAPPPEPQPNLFFRAIDTLDTPRQFIAGGIAKLAGIDEYDNLSLSEATQKSRDENLTSAQILREVPGFKGDSFSKGFLRGAVGFGVDVLTDPLSWLSPFGSAVKKGGVAVNQAKTFAVNGKELAENGLQIYNRLNAAALEKVTRETAAAVGRKATGNVEDIILQLGKSDPSLVSNIMVQAEREAELPFKQLRLFADNAKNQNPLKILSVADDVKLDDLQALEATKILNSMGVQVGDAPVEQALSLIKKPRLQLSSPVAGMETFARIPILGQREIDIPVLSDLSEKVYAKLSEGYYGAPVKLEKFLSDKVSTNPESLAWGAAAKLGKALSAVGDTTFKVLSPLSRRATASGRLFGSNAASDALKEHELARGVLGYQAITEGTATLRPLLADAEGEELVSKGIAEIIESQIDNPRGFDIAYDNLRVTLNAKKPGFGDTATQVLDAVENRFAQMGKLEAEAGFFDGTLSQKLQEGIAYGYVSRIFKAKEGDDLFQNPVIKQFVNDLSGKGKAPDFSLKRTFKTIKDAERSGLEVDKNIYNILTSRIYAHKMVMAEKDFAERIAYQYAFPRQNYDALKQLALNNTSSKQKDALIALKRLGLQVPVDEIYAAGQSGVMEIAGGQFLQLNGRPFTLDAYQSMKQQVMDPSITGPARQRIVDDIAQIRDKYGYTFKWDDQELVAMTQHDAAIKAQTGLLDRSGEMIITRAGAAQLSDTMRKGMKNLTPDEEQFWSGLLPRSFVDAYQDSMFGVKSLKAYAEKMRANNPNDAMAKSLSAVLKVADSHRKIMQFGMTQFWPSYWVRNMASAPLQGNVIKSMTTIGDSLNLVKNAKIYYALRNKTDLLTETGEKLNAATLSGELASFGMTGWNENSMADIADFTHDVLLSMSDDARILKQIPQVNQLRDKAALKQLEGWKYARVRSKAKDIANFLENFGRQQVYVNLRLQGYSPTSAYQEMSKAMVDYARGKTSFESTWMNNIIFFYSFARGNASNMFHALLAKPGALTTQLHAIDGVTEMLIDPNNYVKEDAVDERLQTMRNALSMSRYIGTNPETGLPRVVQSFGDPMSDLAKWVNLVPGRRPIKNMGDLFDYAGEAGTNATRMVFSQTNPILKGITETLLFKRNLFFDRPITDENLRKIASWEKSVASLANYAYDAVPNSIWQNLDSGLQAMLGGRKTPDGDIIINPYAMSLLVNVVPGAARLVNTLDSATDPGIPESSRKLRLWSGINVAEIKPEQSMAYERNRQINEYLDSRGISKGSKRATFRLGFEPMQAEDE